MTALRAGLERAIADGKGADAAAIAKELADRVAALSAEDVVPIRPAQRRS